MTCHSCGGIIGRDCFNPQECAEISHMMEERQRQQIEQMPDELSALWQKLASLEARVAELEAKQ